MRYGSYQQNIDQIDVIRYIHNEEQYCQRETPLMDQICEIIMQNSKRNIISFEWPEAIMGVCKIFLLV